MDILREPADGAEEAMIDRIVHLGFEVRVELTLGDGEQTWVQTTKAQSDELELSEGEIVWLRPNSPARTRPRTRPFRPRAVSAAGGIARWRSSSGCAVVRCPWTQ